MSIAATASLKLNLKVESTRTTFGELTPFGYHQSVPRQAISSFAYITADLFYHYRPLTKGQQYGGIVKIGTIYSIETLLSVYK